VVDVVVGVVDGVMVVIKICCQEMI
jgi:hypothetical protein